jgi:iron-sulfur cluster repair protein YtfE (RIC family)
MKLTGSRNSAIALLESQHKKVKAIFKKLEGGKGDAQALLTELASDLTGHMKIEQDIFYPAIREVDEDLILESFEEHSLAEIGLKRLLGTDSKDPTFKAKVTTLKELIEHHVSEEEEELFPKVEKKLSADQLVALGKQMKVLFDETVEQGYETTFPRGKGTSADAAEKKVLRQMSSEAAE